MTYYVNDWSWGSLLLLCIPVVFWAFLNRNDLLDGLRNLIDRLRWRFFRR